jgi:hypothetical protein
VIDFLQVLNRPFQAWLRRILQVPTVVRLVSPVEVIELQVARFAVISKNFIHGSGGGDNQITFASHFTSNTWVPLFEDSFSFTTIQTR